MPRSLDDLATLKYQIEYVGVLRRLSNHSRPNSASLGTISLVVIYCMQESGLSVDVNPIHGALLRQGIHFPQEFLLNYSQASSSEHIQGCNSVREWVSPKACAKRGNALNMEITCSA